jgi:hypothetical protein
MPAVPYLRTPLLSDQVREINRGVTAGETAPISTSNEDNEMAKIKENQLDMFPVTPEITNIGITKFETKGAEVIAMLSGVTNVNDVALLTDECWKLAVAEWLLLLCKGEVEGAKMFINKAWSRIQSLEEAA